MKRRDLLRYGISGAAALPFLPSLISKSAFATENAQLPKRLVLITHPNGVHPTYWHPIAGSSSSDFTLNRSHQPLLPFKDKLTILSGVDNKIAQTGPGGPHQRGMGALFTGSPLLQASAENGGFVGGDGSLAGWAGSISIDQKIAQKIGQQTLIPSLHLGVRATTAEVRSRISYAAAKSPIPPVNDPAQAFNLLFENQSMDTSVDPTILKRSRQRGSVLDAVNKQITLLSKKASKLDRERLEQHLDFVRTLERKVKNIGGMSGSCVPPSLPVIMDAENENLMPTVSAAQIDLITAAFSCDLTRVATLQFGNAQNQIRFPFLDTTPETPNSLSPSNSFGHSLSHLGAGNVKRNEVALRDAWHAEQVAKLIANLAAIPEGEGSILDHTLIIWASEISVGNSHSLNDIPFLCAGGSALGLQTGRYLQLNNQNHNNFLLSVLRLFDIEDQTFGDVRFCEAPISEFYG